MFLHAASLELEHPVTGERLRVDAPLPTDLAAFRRRHIDEHVKSMP
jgi:23S rRNA pseudouridine955/2504/2580 synthase